jgi:hypothetical protein
MIQEREMYGNHLSPEEFVARLRDACGPSPIFDRDAPTIDCWDQDFTSIGVDSIMCYELIVLSEELAFGDKSVPELVDSSAVEVHRLSDIYRYYLLCCKLNLGLGDQKDL